MAASLTQFGITWTFDGNYTTGQYANGDYYVVAPSGLTIIGITPASTVSAGRTINGSMVNPDAGDGTVSQGFDSAMEYNTFDAALNVARPNGNDLSAENPLAIAAGSSLVSTISNATAGARPQITDAAVLTIVASAPDANSFRPPYQGSDKTHHWNKSDLDYSVLRSLSSVAGTPTLSTVAAYFERPWIEINTSWPGRYMHPTNNQPDYGTEMAYLLSSGMLSLHLDYTNEQKETLLVRLVQYGIDIYGAAKEGGVWRDLGGHNQGRKAVMLFAGLVLDDANITGYADAAEHFIFQEDLQTWYVTEADVGRPLYTADGRPREEYIEGDVGVAEWGEQHTSQPNRDGRNWDAFYRNNCGSSFVGHAMGVGLVAGARAAWNWEAFWDYTWRFYQVDPPINGTGGTYEIQTFDYNMVLAYSGLVYGPTAPTDLTATTSGSSAIDLAWTDSATDETGYVVQRSPNGSTGWTTIATLDAGATSYTDTGLAGGTAYHYRVAASNAYGSSAYSASANATTDTPPVLRAGVSPNTSLAAMFF